MIDNFDVTNAWTAMHHPHSSPDVPEGVDNFLSPLSLFFWDCGVEDGRILEPVHKHELPSNIFTSDPSVDIPRIFEGASSSPLSDPGNGLRRQGTALNLTEVARAIVNHVPLMVVSDSLAWYHVPCWKLLTKRQSIRAIEKITYTLYPQDAPYISCRQFEDIYQSLLYSPNLTSIEVIPAPDEQVLCCRDYMIDLQTGHQYPHHHKDLRFSFLDLRAEDIGRGSGEYFENFIATVTDGNMALRQRVLEMIGVILTGAPAKSFFYLWGVSGSGKTQLAKFLEALLGWDNCYSISGINALADRWTTGMLVGKLLCICGDIPDRPLNSETISRIKQISGSDCINGERKHMDPFTFECTAKLLLIGNYPLHILPSQREPALIDRLVEIYFPTAIPRDEQEPNFYRILLEESGYIAGAALDALAMLRNRGYVFTEVDMPSQVFTSQQPSLDNFISKFCEFDNDAVTPTSELYRKFCSMYPVGALPGYSLAQFGYYLAQQYPKLRSVRSSKMRGYRGIRLCDTDDQTSFLGREVDADEVHQL